MVSPIIIASHSKREAITQWILEHQETLGHSFIWVDVQDILNTYCIHDILSQEGTRIEWKRPDGYTITNRDHTLWNRTLYIPKDWFLDFQVEDRVYAQREFEAYLGFAFDAFDGVDNVYPNGLCAPIQSLPMQWRAASPYITVPTYYWGDRRSNPLKGPLVYSQAYHMLHWKVNAEDKAHRTIFCFKKPRGKPVFVFWMGDECLIAASVEYQEEIKAYADILRPLFSGFTYEMLFFVDKENITFGCVNYDIVGSRGHPEWDRFLYTHLVDEWQVWIKRPLLPKHLDQTLLLDI